MNIVAFFIGWQTQAVLISALEIKAEEDMTDYLMVNVMGSEDLNWSTNLAVREKGCE